MMRRAFYRSAWVGLWLSLSLLWISQVWSELPKSQEEFEKVYAEAGKTPEGALKLWFDGIFLYGSKDSNAHLLGKYILERTTKELSPKKDWEKASSVYTFVKRMKSMPHIFRSYAKGTSPENEYKMDPNNYELNIIHSGEDPYGNNGYVIRLKSSGADNPRPIYLRQSKKTGLWRITRFSNIYLEVRKPGIDDED